MTTLNKSVVVAALICAAGLVYYQMRQIYNLRCQVSELKQSSASVPVARSPTPQPMDEVEKTNNLEAVNIALSNSLAQAKAMNAHLNSARLRAEQLAQAYKEIADKAVANDPTNRFPTVRHLLAGMGSLMRRSTISLNTSQTDGANMTPEQITARQAEAITLADDASAVMKAGQSFDGEMKSGPRDVADDSACMLYGALDLNEQQFTQAYSIIQGLRDQAKAQNLLGVKASPENQTALAQWNEQAQAQIQQILNPDQTALFQLMSTSLLEQFRDDKGMGGGFSCGVGK